MLWQLRRQGQKGNCVSVHGVRKVATKTEKKKKAWSFLDSSCFLLKQKDFNFGSWGVCKGSQITQYPTYRQQVCEQNIGV